MGIVFCYGTRPEAIKTGPVVAELKALGITPTVISTNQHWDLLKGTPAETDLADSVSLGLPANGDPRRWALDALPAVRSALRKADASLVCVQGDTASALAGASAAYDLQLPVVHIEAGVRSGNLQEPWPEEGFRRQITQYATWHYAPTQHCVENLLAEGVDEAQIRLTGNPVVSALQRYANASPKPAKQHILLTMHRREWLERVDMLQFHDALREACALSEPLEIVWPMHPAVAARWSNRWTEPPNLTIQSPLPYGGMVAVLSTAHGLATDSGGLVEEATTLGIPTAILRNSNDRPEAVEAGIARQYPPESIQDAIRHLADIKHPRTPSDVFGTPQSAFHIASHLACI